MRQELDWLGISGKLYQLQQRSFSVLSSVLLLSKEVKELTLARAFWCVSTSFLVLFSACSFCRQLMSSKIAELHSKHHHDLVFSTLCFHCPGARHSDKAFSAILHAGPGDATSNMSVNVP